MIRRSGLFDAEWYATQLKDAGLRAGDLVEHYLTHGAGLGLSPNPCFDAEWYRRQSGVPRNLSVPEFVHFAGRGSRRGVSPNPLLDVTLYTEQHPEAYGHRGGPLGHYLAGGWRAGHPGQTWLDDNAIPDAMPEEPPLRALGRLVRRHAESTRNHEAAARSSSTFDEQASELFVERTTRAYARCDEAPPLVSVVIPTHNRAVEVVQAIESVLAQTYANWEVILVDDGSTDSTSDDVQPLLSDSRIIYRRLEGAHGVSGARNAGLELASGEYIAYLDSDNTWEPRFLEVMVAFVRTHGLRWAYAVSALEEVGGEHRRAFRALPYNRQALRERNFIDCIVVLHERDLLMDVGTFDTGLRRNVDWDLFIRLAEVSEPRLAPFIGTRYDVWEERGNRITTHEPFAYRFAVLAKHHVRWSQGELDPELTSVVLHAHGSLRNVMSSTEGLLRHVSTPVEVLLVDAQRPEADLWELLGMCIRDSRVRLLRQTLPLSAELARNIGATSARGSRLVFSTSRIESLEDWVTPLVQALADPEVSVVQPRIVSGDGTVASVGTEILRRGAVTSPWAGFPADAPEVTADHAPAATAPMCFAARTADVRAIGGFDPLYVNDEIHPDLSLRLTELHGTRARTVAASTVFLRSDQRSVPKVNVRAYLDNRRRFTETHPSRVETFTPPYGWSIRGHRHVPTRRGHVHTVLGRTNSPRPLRWAIKIGPDDVFVRENWGDWHFALALKRSLEELGHEVVVDCRSSWYRETALDDDVVLVIRGVGEYVPNPQHTNLLWVISHPDRVTPHEVRAFDAVFAASVVVAERFSRWRGDAVETLFQCVDPSLFTTEADTTDDGPATLFVGNARGIRPSVAAALEAGYSPHVYGVRWDSLLPDGLWRSRYVANTALAALYSSAGVVLNDHWEDMRREGIISNRVFDLVACGARVVSDDVPGLDALFGDVVLTFHDAASMRASIETHLAEDASRRTRRLEMSAHVRSTHSFAARSARLDETVRRLRGAAGAHAPQPPEGLTGSRHGLG